ncbi:phenoloxidase-activating factor 2-like [Metopolophium dirhodum]|uniref:phenoloxidase-activating factor 2-like n=1 Tax=Metopolophium dirhodum TaxID=44670 RepID=UPI0029906B88|nr:phenoloxidase-activating factor 2-like [Metopolophium dirhodum]
MKLYVLLSVTLLLQVTSTLVFGEEENITSQKHLSEIGEVFPKPPTRPSPTVFCICVPYHLCRNKTIVRRISIDIRPNEEPCPNSLDVCCYDQIKPKDTPNISYYEHRTFCGHWNSAGVGLGINGHSNDDAQFGEFPWMMAILKLGANNSKTHLCGGSLIHPKVVLTAAHCVISKNPKDLVIRAGEWDLQTENELLPSQDHEVLKIINHENFDPHVIVNDVSLIIVTKPFLLRENVGTLCLPSPNYVFDRQRCYASGWGKKVFGKLAANHVILKKIDLPVVPRSSCLELLRKTRLGMDYILPEGFICAGGETGKDTCQGDGGNPLMCPIENRPKQFQQAGIVAWGIGCGNEIPGMYVDVALFRNWIDEQMAKEELDTSYYDPDY